MIGLRTKVKKLSKKAKRYFDMVTGGANLGKLRIILQEMGLEEGDSIIVHSSLSSFGHIEGGANAIIDLFLDIIGPAGTLVMPTFPASTTTYEYVKSEKRFSVLESPSKVGSITETFRKKKGVLRSLHPTHPCAALGPNSEWLLNEHHLDPNPFGPKSPFYKLIITEGKSVNLGATLNTTTTFRVYESIATDYPEKIFLEKPFEMEVLDQKNQLLIVPTLVHDPNTSARRLNTLLDQPLSTRRRIITKTYRGTDIKVLLLADLLKHMEDLCSEGVIPYTKI